MRAPSLRLPPARRAAPRGRSASCAGALLLLALAVGACSDDRPRPGSGTDSTTAPPRRAVAEEACRLGPAQVTARGAGVVRLGMTADELRRRCLARDTTLTLGEGLVERAVVVHVDRARAVALTDSAGVVSRVVVPVRGPSTPGGVGVGSRLISVQARHGRLCALLGEGRVVVAAPRLAGVSFVTNADYGRVAADSSLLRDTRFLRRTRVTELIVHGGPSACERP